MMDKNNYNNKDGCQADCNCHAELAPTLWNSMLGRRSFLKRTGSATVAAAIAMHGFQTEVLASASGEPLCSGCSHFNIGWNYSYQLTIPQQIPEEVEAYQDTTWEASDITPGWQAVGLPVPILAWGKGPAIPIENAEPTVGGATVDASPSMIDGKLDKIIKDVVITLSVFVVTFAVGGCNTPPGSNPPDESEFDVPALDPFGI